MMSRALAIAGRAGWHLFGMAVVVYLLAPLILAFAVSFYPGRTIGLPTPATGVTFDWYAEFFNDSRWVAGLRNSFAVGAISTAISLACGLTLAIAVTRHGLRGEMVFGSPPGDGALAHPE